MTCLLIPHRSSLFSTVSFVPYTTKKDKQLYINGLQVCASKTKRNRGEEIPQSTGASAGGKGNPKGADSQGEEGALRVRKGKLR